MADTLLLDCDTCDLSRHVRLDAADALVAQARAFFLDHASCRTRIDRTARLDGWRVAAA